jgi:hypothetical protein
VNHRSVELTLDDDVRLGKSLFDITEFVADMVRLVGMTVDLLAEVLTFQILQHDRRARLKGLHDR